ncbi:GntR family transcriptional regulator [Sphingosinicella ginsenosidimutans]|uniref:GntR family transcriptional regulator n=1 Tax=Allosphingosinicella ginsenosidimutans TaxID=1176539 RepID=A0A5C6TUS4_9SPHN|nr:GntR family transcriptional regulator [Sphingosinicella ginsenosidimutans]TXC63438.1 GntR family transcriptional regulator [Sphingosinicella ginsenosidimutans]
MLVEKGESAVAIDRMQAVPLYHQIFLQLREEITSGERTYGSRMPTEQELSAQFGVSRITARRALDELAEHHLVERKRRVGTHVIFRSPVKPLQGNIAQALESLLNFGRATQVKLLEVDRVPARAPIDEALGLAEGTTVLRVVRDRWLDGQPLAHFVSYTPMDIGARMTRAKLKSTPMLTLIAEAGVTIGSATQTISATLADAALSSSLHVDIGSPVLRVSRTVLDTRGRPVQHILGQFRPDRYQIRLDLNSSSNIGPELI